MPKYKVRSIRAVKRKRSTKSVHNKGGGGQIIISGQIIRPRQSSGVIERKTAEERVAKMRRRNRQNLVERGRKRKGN